MAFLFDLRTIFWSQNISMRAVCIFNESSNFTIFYIVLLYYFASSCFTTVVEIVYSAVAKVSQKLCILQSLKIWTKLHIWRLLQLSPKLSFRQLLQLSPKPSIWQLWELSVKLSIRQLLQVSPKIDCSAVVTGVQKTFYLTVETSASKTVYSTFVTAVTKTVCLTVVTGVVKVVYSTVETLQNLIAVIDHEIAAKNPQVLLLPLVIKHSVHFFCTNSLLHFVWKVRLFCRLKLDSQLMVDFILDKKDKME